MIANVINSFAETVYGDAAKEWQGSTGTEASLFVERWQDAPVLPADDKHFNKNAQSSDL